MWSKIARVRDGKNVAAAAAATTSLSKVSPLFFIITCLLVDSL